MAEAFYEDEDNLKKLCDFLRGKEGPAVREAIEMDKRVYYLKGESSESVGRSGNAGSASVGMHSFALYECASTLWDLRFIMLCIFLTTDIELVA